MTYTAPTPLDEPSSPSAYVRLDDDKAIILMARRGDEVMVSVLLDNTETVSESFPLAEFQSFADALHDVLK